MVPSVQKRVIHSPPGPSESISGLAALTVRCRRACTNHCNSQGGSPSGSNLDSFRCELVYVPTEVCIRVTRFYGKWMVADGTLPDRITGPYGPGQALSHQAQCQRSCKEPCVFNSPGGVY